MTGTVPLPGPLEHDPTTAVTEQARKTGLTPETVARAMLGAAAVRLQRGAWDEQVLTMVATRWDVSTIATLASWLRRAFEDGIAVGHAELVDATPRVQELLAEAQELSNRLAKAVDQWHASVPDAEQHDDAAQLLAVIEAAIRGAR